MRFTVWRRLSQLLLPLAAVAACGSGAVPPSSGPAAPPPAANTPPAATADAPTAAEPAADPRREAVERAVKRVADVQLEVAELRSLQFRQPVPAAYQTKADFQTYLTREVKKEFPEELNVALSRAVAHLGLVKSRVDLAAMLLDTLVSQTGAYYDPDSNKFYIVTTPQNPVWLDTLSAHELTHGIQHQNFDLMRYYGLRGEDKRRLTEDEMNARRFVVEGEATFLMMAYLTRKTTGKDPFSKEGMNILSAQLGAMAAMDTDMMIELNKRQAAQVARDDPDMQAAVAAMDKIPRYLLVPLFSSYVVGAMTSYEAYAAGGWKSVNALYAEPPQSTEQVLHPADKLVGKRDYPVTLTLPEPRALAGWKPVHTDVLGELQWRTYFGTWKVADAAGAADGWDGDQVRVYADGERTASVLATTWDSADEARAFETAYLSSLSTRFPGAKTNKGKRGVTVVVASPERTIAVQRRKADVYVADAPASVAEKALADLARTRKSRHKNDR